MSFDQLRSSAAGLARSIIAGEAGGELLHRMIRDINGKEGIETPEDPGPVIYGDMPTEERIGIWKSGMADGRATYLRDVNYATEWNLWANQHTISRNSPNKRIVLLGESVARGYFYDPFYNPAMELQSIFNTVEGLEDMEVVDLAKCGANMAELSSLVIQCLALEPAAIVVFAGNNWGFSLLHPGVFTADELRSLADALRSCAFSQFKLLLEEKMRSIVAGFMQQLGDLSVKHNIPVFFVVPEFNLSDWKSSSREQIVTKLPGGAAAKWVAHREKAEALIEKQDLCGAGAVAAEMIAIDSTNPLGYEILAYCKLRQGETDEVRELLEAAKDTTMFYRVANYSPRCFSAIREAILTEGNKHNIGIVDLPEVFKRYLSGGIPGRTLFLDYCHLTMEGIKVAMEATASSILPLFTQGASPVTPMSDVVPRPEVIAMAHVFASIHNARCGQPEEIVEHHCTIAVSTSGVARQFMPLFVSLSARKAATFLCKGYEQIVSGKLADQYLKGGGLLHPDGCKLMEVKLADCMVAALQQTGIHIKDQLDVLRKKEHAGKNGRVNLLESYYHMFDVYKIPGAGEGYYKARGPVSAFIMVTEGDGPLWIQLTCRVPGEKDASAFIRIKINDKEIGRLPADRRWSTHRILVPAEARQEGVSHLNIIWPISHKQESTHDNTDSDATTQDNLFMDLYPVLGEVHMLYLCKDNC